MKLTFSVHYNTHWGQSLRIVGSSAAMGSGSPEKAPAMTYHAGGTWTFTLSLIDAEQDDFSYAYCVMSSDGDHVEREAGPLRDLPKGLKGRPDARVVDTWRVLSAEDTVLQTAMFTQAVFGGKRSRRAPVTPAVDAAHGVLFRVTAPRIPEGCHLGVIGSPESLGAWSPENALAMDGSDYPAWSLTLPLTSPRDYFEYKYVLVKSDTGAIVEYEAGQNRRYFPSVDVVPPTFTIQNDVEVALERGRWRGTGVAVPVFALRSKQSLGAGDFTDIRLLADWAERVGMNMIQLLPINDTVATHTWTDSYPYAAISVFALHPIYMNLDAMGVFDAKTMTRMIGKDRQRLNALAEVDYEEVMRVKSWFFKQAYDADRDRFLADPQYLAFFEDNQEWLVPYAVFSCLRDRYGSSAHETWPDNRSMSQAELEAFASPKDAHYDDVAVHYFIQYHLHVQLLDAANYARSKGVALKGDIPIGVFRHSVDTWMEPESFNMAGQAGAPPDYFSTEGQNWGFPTYNWHVMAQDGFAWWCNRLVKLSTYFDAFRIDHILGFFRIWEIPIDALSGTLGRFNPALPLSRSELESRGIAFDEGRLTQPYIREHMLGELFGVSAEGVKEAYLEPVAEGQYRLRKGVETQREIAQHFQDETDPIRRGLMTLAKEVLLLEAPMSDGAAFNPRISMEDTWSFRELDPQTRSALWSVYVDYFYHRHEHFWADQGRFRLPAIKEATEMMICGEDLGMVPDCVPQVMDDLGILCLRIQRMPIDAAQDYQHPAGYPYMCVASPSSHDVSTLRGWWSEDRVVIQNFYNHCLGMWGEAPAECTPDIVRRIFDQHLYSPAMWAVFPLQDILALDEGLRRDDPLAERINDPASIPHYWRYRCHLDLEDLLQADAFNTSLQNMISESGRGL